MKITKIRLHLVMRVVASLLYFYTNIVQQYLRREILFVETKEAIRN